MIRDLSECSLSFAHQCHPPPAVRPGTLSRVSIQGLPRALSKCKLFTAGLGSKGCGDPGGTWQVRAGCWDVGHLDRQHASAVSPGEGSSGGRVPLAACESLHHRTDTWPELGLCPSEPEKGWGSWNPSGQASNSQYWCQHPVPLILMSPLPSEHAND